MFINSRNSFLIMRLISFSVIQVYSKKLALINFTTAPTGFINFFQFQHSQIALTEDYVLVYFEILFLHLRKKNEVYKQYNWKSQKDYIILLNLCDGLLLAIVKTRSWCHATFTILKTRNQEKRFRPEIEIDKNSQKIFNPVEN